MSAPRSATLVALSCLAAACGPPGDGAVPCGQLAARNEAEVELCNGLDQALIARLELPAGDPPASGWPAVVLLHGSGGLFKADDGYPCSETLQDEFRFWADQLTAEGYAVIMPDSFFSRGFCDWHKQLTVPRELTEDERLVVRTFDAVAAGDYLCDDPRFDCSHLAMLGFSNGASTTLMVMQEDLSVASDTRLHELDGTRPPFVGAVAYYPGCGLQDQLASDVDTAELERFFYPSASMWVALGSKDNLHENCEELRDPQVDMVAEHRGVTHDMFETKLYSGAKHGFDAAESDDAQADIDARDDARARVFELFAGWL